MSTLEARIDRIAANQRAMRRALTALLAETTPDDGGQRSCGCDWAAAENHDQLLTWLRCDTASDLMAFIDGAASWNDDHEPDEPVVHPEHWVAFARGHDLPNVNLTREALWRARITTAHQQLAGHATTADWAALEDQLTPPAL